MKIAFIGLGHMGFPIASRMANAGHTVTGYDVFEKSRDRFASQGNAVASSPADAAANADVVITMVPDRPEVLDAAINGDTAITQSIQAGATYIDLSTVDPGTSLELAAHFRAKGVKTADAPVARSVQDAHAGTSATMVGCDEALFKEIEPILGCFANRIVYCGGNGAGSAMKLVNNYINQGTIALIAEALTAGVGNGLTLELMLEVLNSTNAANANLARAMTTKAFVGDFSAGFMVKLANKDQRLALQMMQKIGMDPKIGLATQNALNAAVESGYGDDDLSSLFRVVEGQVGFKARFAGAT